MSTEWTVERVIEEAAKKGGWYLTKFDQVRRPNDSGTRASSRFKQCPLSCLAGACEYDALNVAESMHIPESVGMAVMTAADSITTNPDNERIRKAMLSAFGLSEEPGR